MRRAVFLWVQTLALCHLFGRSCSLILVRELLSICVTVGITTQRASMSLLTHVAVNARIVRRAVVIPPSGFASTFRLGYRAYRQNYKSRRYGGGHFHFHRCFHLSAR